MNGLIEWIIFLALSAVAIVTAAGMILTMSMYRAGLALIASFVALAGLFILLNADLLAAIQVMMNVGGMLVMILFMVMMMMDPGGEMMWGMKRDMDMPGPGAFSMHMPWGKSPEDDQSEQQTQAKDWTCPMHPEVNEPTAGSCPKCGMTLIPRAEALGEQSTHDMDMTGTSKTYTCPMHPEIQQDQPGKCPKCGMTLVEQTRTDQADGQIMAMEHGTPTMDHDMSTLSTDHESQTMLEQMMSGMSISHESHESNNKKQDNHGMGMSNHDMNMGGMNMSPRQNYDMMVDMAMSTAQLPWAIIFGVISALLLIVLVIFTPWPLATIQPTQDATNAVGQLLLSRYMIGFEGAAFLILAGIAGAVLLGKRERPSATTKQEQSPEAGATETDMTDMTGITSTADTKDTRVYSCPMHPEVRQNGPNKCPTCGMNLMPGEEIPASSGQQKGERS